MEPHQLLAKYNVPGPRYTSYPTVPHWNTEAFSVDQWLQRLSETFDRHNATEGISLYIHLPFCETLCTYCACHKRITQRHQVEGPYVDALLAEWQLYVDHLGQRPRIRELHLGGGTPTFFAPEQLERLMQGLFAHADLTPDHALSVEAHPNVTQSAHLETLARLGFRRISFGVQEYSTKVQQAINREQSFDRVKDLTQQARRVGFTSVSHDLVYGLPFQTMDDVEQTVAQTATIRPDRVAYYSYAHVPWQKGNGQRGYDESSLPSAVAKFAMQQAARQQFAAQGYAEVGMDHFALPGDELLTARQQGRLNRNFMGYTPYKAPLIIGLGASSIGDTGHSFAQNEKNIEAYQATVSAGQWPVVKGHLHTDTDRTLRQHIANLMCRSETAWHDPADQWDGLAATEPRLLPLAQDGLVEMGENHVRVTELGRHFVRNVAMALDPYLHGQQGEPRRFSMTV